MNKSILNMVFFICLICQIGSLRKEKNEDFQISIFTSFINSWRTSYKALHFLSDDIFNFVSGQENSRTEEIPTEEFLKIANEAFPIDEESVKKVPKIVLGTWVLIEDDSELGETIDRETAYRVIQSKAEYIIESELYGGAEFISAGPFKHSAEFIIESVTQSFGDYLHLADKLFNKADVNNNGEIDLNEFLHSYAHLLNQEDRERAKEIFERFDADHSGFLVNLEVHHFLAVILFEKNDYYVVKGSESKAAKHSEVSSRRHKAKKVSLGKN
jgi:hypothetical protein